MDCAYSANVWASLKMYTHVKNIPKQIIRKPVEIFPFDWDFSFGVMPASAKFFWSTLKLLIFCNFDCWGYAIFVAFEKKNTSIRLRVCPILVRLNSSMNDYKLIKNLCRMALYIGHMRHVDDRISLCIWFLSVIWNYVHLESTIQNLIIFFEEYWFFSWTNWWICASLLFYTTYGR